MTKIDKGTAGLLAALEERSAQIRELEREITGLKGMIGKLEIDLGAKDEEISRAHEGWSETRARCRKAQDTLALVVPTLDGTADRQRAEKAERALRVREGVIGDMQETISYLRGWIDARQGREPHLNGGALTATDGECVMRRE